MNKTELIEAISEGAGLTKKDSEKALDAVVSSITNALNNGDKVSLIGFGTFETRNRAARTGKTPQTGEPLQIAAATVPAFKAGKALKDAVAK